MSFVTLAACGGEYDEYTWQPTVDLEIQEEHSEPLPPITLPAPTPPPSLVINVDAVRSYTLEQDLGSVGLSPSSDEALISVVQLVFDESEVQFFTTLSSDGDVSELFAQTYQRINGKIYVVVTNRSSQVEFAELRVRGLASPTRFDRIFVAASFEAFAAPSASHLTEERVLGLHIGRFVVPPFSITRIEW